MNGMKRKLMVFHQYLAPYRIDFFNALARRGDMEAFFEYEDSPDHHYNRREMESRCVFRPRYLNHVPVAGRRIPLRTCVHFEGREAGFGSCSGIFHSGPGSMPAACGFPLEVPNHQHLR